MPIYEYLCAACGFQKEVLQKISDAPLTVCPECGKPSMQKLVSAAGFQLKGTGWYATDFKKSDKPKKEERKPKKEESKSGEEKKPAASRAKSACPSCE